MMMHLKALGEKGLRVIVTLSDRTLSFRLWDRRNGCLGLIVVIMIFSLSFFPLLV